MLQISPERLVENFIAVAAIFVPLWYVNREQQKRQHRQNSDKLDTLLDEQAERPSHLHMDAHPDDPRRSGPLTADQVRYRPKRRSEDDH